MDESRGHGHVEREVKLRFSDAAAARTAVTTAGGAPYRARRLQHDCLLDTPDGLLRAERAALRVRMEDGAAVLTFKGPVQPAAMKVREEIETSGGSADALLTILQRLGFVVWFRYEKYREEFTARGAVVAIDETPVGTFIEIEGTETSVVSVVEALGRSSRDYVLDSYRGLFVKDCQAHGRPVGDMLFGRV